MARLHAEQDIYLGDALALTGTQILEQHVEHRLVVRARNPVGGQWVDRLVLVDTDLLQGSTAGWIWTGTVESTDIVSTNDHPGPAVGDVVRLTAIRRSDAPSCCGR